MYAEKNIKTKIEGSIILIIIIGLVVIVSIMYIQTENYKTFVGKCKNIGGNIDLENTFICWVGIDKYIYKEGGFYYIN